ncbi:type IV pilus modification PilV family protein [Ilyobacter polytropus]|uniref:Uncharacterized protein n=1 Tax=Ilyobacter polytropus (strain ATCC 51220 / DSM 2926 / LMG 16218 / CuHBu1) TaxID=572544 RepID=E3H6Y3_ILYPC|nr:hypothetical protein [Ilyobacter polytropus]ADO82502.1 hypothetical protein Ilyop_0715 [Ilyobacter polytropus DSM 2926]
MNKKGSVLIECLIAIVIFLIGIVPITNFTISSLSIDRRSNEIEEAARITTTVIDYIKSEGYDTILAKNYWGTDTYKIASGSVQIDSDNNKSNEILGSSFDLEGRGIDLEDAELTISVMKSDLVLDTTETYTNPVTSVASNVLFGSSGLSEEQFIYGRVTLKYESLKNGSGEKTYGQNFILAPIENRK